MAASGDVDAAAKYYAEAISDFEQIGDRSSAAEAQTSLANLLVEQQKPVDAGVLARTAVEEFPERKSLRR